MSTRKEISLLTRNLAREERKSYGEITNMIKISCTTVQLIVKNFKLRCRTPNEPRPRCSTKLSALGQNNSQSAK